MCARAAASALRSDQSQRFAWTKGLSVVLGPKPQRCARTKGLSDVRSSRSRSLSDCAWTKGLSDVRSGRSLGVALGPKVSALCLDQRSQRCARAEASAMYRGQMPQLCAQVNGRSVVPGPPDSELGPKPYVRRIRHTELRCKDGAAAVRDNCVGSAESWSTTWKSVDVGEATAR